MIRFNCACGNPLQAPVEDIGKLVDCTKCSRCLLVPAEGTTTEAVVQDQIRPESAKPDPWQTDNRELDDPWQTDNRELDDQPPVSGNTGTSGKARVSLILGILSLFFNVLTALPAILLGIQALEKIAKSHGRMRGRGLALAGIVTAGIGTLLSCVVVGFLPYAMRDSASNKLSQNHLKQMALAMHSVNDATGAFPPQGSGDQLNGGSRGQKPLLSWRVAILPYIEESSLFWQFKLDEPWDGPNNIKLLPMMPKIYRIPTDNNTPPDHTHYQVFVGNGAAFEKDRETKLTDFANGGAGTILIVEAAQAVPWTKPEDIPFNPNEPISPLLSKHFRGANAVMANGSIRFFPRETPDSTLETAIKR